MVTRRRFLKIAALGGIPVAVGSIAALSAVPSFTAKAGRWAAAVLRSPEARLRAHFYYLDIDPDAAARFVNDCVQHRPGFSRHRPLGPDVHTDFLLSTDFFRHGADASRRVHYVGYYDPTVTACNNPLARFDDEREG